MLYRRIPRQDAEARLASEGVLAKLIEWWFDPDLMWSEVKDHRTDDLARIAQDLAEFAEDVARLRSEHP